MIDILFEDARLLVLCKPEGLASIPERFEGRNMLAEAEAYLGGKAFVVHRLDKDVSGVLLFAKDADTHRHLSLQFEHRQVDKRYRAIVHGDVRGEGDVVRAPLRLFGSGRMGVDEEQGKPSETRFVVQARREGFTAVDVFPVTGRRHQIRVHLYYAGPPIVGDRMYGEPAVQRLYPRLFLHACLIRFRHPDGRLLTVEAAVPETFEAFVASL